MLYKVMLLVCGHPNGGGRNRIGRREKWPKKRWEEGEIEGKSREEGEIGSESRQKGDLPPCPPQMKVIEQYFHVVLFIML